MVFAKDIEINYLFMTRSNTSSGTTILIILIIVFTFPIWIGLAGGLFGIVAGLFGAAIGIIAAVCGAIIGGIAAMMGALFSGWPDSHYGLTIFLLLCFVFALVLLTRAGKRK